MTISIIIPTYNRKEILASLLESLTTDKYIPEHVKIEIIVSDDRSPDGTAQMVRERFATVRLLEGPGLGAEKNKRGAVEDCTGDFIVNLDDDSMPRHGWIGAVIPDLERGEKLVQSKLVFTDLGQEELEDESPKHFFTGYRWDLMPLMITNGGHKPQYLSICHEFGLFMAREVLQQEPLDDPNLVSDYGAAASFYQRVSKRGYKVFFQPKSVIFHLGSNTGGLKDFEGKKSPKANCDEYTTRMVYNTIILGRQIRSLRIPFIAAYFLAGSLYLSLRQRKNCFKYFYRGIEKGLRRKLVPPIPYEHLR